MSIVERAAKLLGPDPATRTEPSTAGQDTVTNLDLIDRAVSRLTEPHGRIEPKELGRQPSVVGLEADWRTQPQAPVARAPRLLSIDLDRLRRQGFITPGGDRTPISEGFRRIKRHVLANAANPKSGAPANLVQVTSALAGEGKTFCAINLAISIALEVDHSVLLVDADVARPGIPLALDINTKQGLLDVVLEPSIELAEVLWATNIGKLTLLPAGTLHQRSTELLASANMRALLQEMSKRYRDRIIIFDSPPLLAASEAGALASQMGQVVIVVEAGRTTDAVLKAALGSMDRSRITGLLLNKAHSPGPGYVYRGYA
jgi:exopolysaccharide/PEP-CTERM locus tyrosine autokinase